MRTRKLSWQLAAAPPVWLVMLCLLLALLNPAAAAADGDPASDILLAENVFYPYSPAVSPPLQRALNAEAAAARRAGFPIKVALIGGQIDLGAVPSLLGKPQEYADFLEREIDFHARQPLLVVMAAGYGVQALPSPSMRAVPTLPAIPGRTDDDLARAAITAVATLAAADGRHVTRPRLPAPAAGTAPTPDPFVIVLLALASLLCATIILRRRATARTARRRRHP